MCLNQQSTLSARLAAFAPHTDREAFFGRVLAFCIVVARRKLEGFDFRDPAVSAEDIAQHAAMNAHRFLDRFADSRQPFRVWLAWRVYNVVRDVILGTRKKKRSRRALTNFRGLGNARDPRSTCPNRRRDLWHAIGRFLSPIQRQVISLHFQEDLTAPEIAIRLGISRQYARSILGFAMTKLRRRRHEVRAALAA